MRWNRKEGKITLETTIFIILNIVFIVLLMIFVYNSAKGAFIYEEMYAKQIALLIDNAEPDMILGLDMGKVLELAEENRLPVEKIVVLNKEKSKVEVSLSSKGGRSFKYFSDYDIEIKFIQDKLEIKIRERQDVE